MDILNPIELSIIIPAYNAEDTIGQCLESALNQSFRSFEIIVVDDGSSDKTLEIVKRFQESSKLVRCFSIKNSGANSARLFGVIQSRGKYIGFIDSDDTVDKSMYSILINLFKGSEIDIVHCGYRMIYPSRIVNYYGTEKLVRCNRDEGLQLLLAGQEIEPSLCNKIYRRELFDQEIVNLVKSSNIKIYEDLLLNYYLFSKARYSVFYDKCFYNYLVRGNSTANNGVNYQKIYDPLKVLFEIFERESNNSVLKKIVLERILQRLVQLSILEDDVDQKLCEEANLKSRRILSENIHKILFSSSIAKIMKLKIIFVTKTPTAYKMIHKSYERMTGLDKYYEIN